MILVDTSAVYAMSDSQDENHSRSVQLFEELISTDQELLVHSYIVVESAALLQSRLGLPATLNFLRNLSDFRVHWVRVSDHERAVSVLADESRRGLSLVDCMSFVVMARYGVQEALAFDSDFKRGGFDLYQGGRP